MKKSNKGSAVIEITLLMPILLGCIYFYIMLFLFLIDSGNRMEKIAEFMYVTQDMENKGLKTLNEDIHVRTEGKVKIFWIEEKGKLFDIQMEMRKGKDNAVENIRRWQLVTSLF